VDWARFLRRNLGSKRFLLPGDFAEENYRTLGVSILSLLDASFRELDACKVGYRQGTNGIEVRGAGQ